MTREVGMVAGKQRRAPRLGNPPEVEGPHPWAFLRRWRVRAEMTQEDVAARFGTTTTSIHRWETGSTGVEVGTMIELARLFHAPGVDALLHAPPGRRAHELKTWPEPFQAAVDGRKRFEFRKDDRGGYEVGDTLWLREWDPEAAAFTGRNLHAEVTYVLRGPAFGVPEGMAVLSIQPQGDMLR